MYNPGSENKGAHQLRSYCEADLRICFAYAVCWFSNVSAHVSNTEFKNSLFQFYKITQLSQARSNGFHIGATIFGAPKVRMRAPNARSFARGSGGMPPGKVLKKWCNLVASGAFSGWFLLG